MSKKQSGSNRKSGKPSARPPKPQGKSTVLSRRPPRVPGR